MQVVVPESMHRGAGEPRAGPETRVRQLVDQHQVVAARECGRHSGVDEIAGAEHAGGLGALEPREARLQLAVQRVVAGDEPRSADADAVALDRRDGRGLEGGVLREPEIVVARERQQPAAVAAHPDAVGALRIGERPAKVRLLQLGELLVREIIE